MGHRHDPEYLLPLLLSILPLPNTKLTLLALQPSKKLHILYLYFLGLLPAISNVRHELLHVLSLA